MNIYDFTVKAQDGSDVALSDYKGKVLLVVNTATECGYTPQYEELQKMYEQYKDKGFEVLDFPCNQFGGQAPGSDEEIHSFCTAKYGITFPQFSKVDVDGENAEPLFKWLTDNTTFEGFDDSPAGRSATEMNEKYNPGYKDSSSIKWNFTKFLIDQNGDIKKRFESMISMENIKAQIEELLD